MTSSASNKMRFLAVFCFWVLLFPGFSQQPDSSIIRTGRWIPPFPPSFEKGLFKARLEIARNKLTGMIFVKRIDSSFRIVFTNEIGMTFFDLGLTESGCKVYAVFPSMDRRIFLDILENDLRSLLFRDQTISDMTLDKITNEGIRLYRTSSKRGTSIYSVERDTRRLLQLETGKGRFQHSEIHYTYGDQDIPAGIYIVNPAINLYINMTALQN